VDEYKDAVAKLNAISAAKKPPAPEPSEPDHGDAAPPDDELPQ